MVIDEAHRIKNEESKLSVVIREIKYVKVGGNVYAVCIRTPTDWLYTTICTKRRRVGVRKCIENYIQLRLFMIFTVSSPCKSASHISSLSKRAAAPSSTEV